MTGKRISLKHPHIQSQKGHWNDQNLEGIFKPRGYLHKKYGVTYNDLLENHEGHEAIEVVCIYIGYYRV